LGRGECPTGGIVKDLRNQNKGSGTEVTFIYITRGEKGGCRKSLKERGSEVGGKLAEGSVGRSDRRPLVRRSESQEQKTRNKTANSRLLVLAIIIQQCGRKFQEGGLDEGVRIRKGGRGERGTIKKTLVQWG